MEQNAITAWRQERGLSQDEAAKALGISRWTVNRIETGNYQPSWKLAHRLHESTGLPLHLLNSDIFPDPQKQEATNG